MNETTNTILHKLAPALTQHAPVTHKFHPLKLVLIIKTHASMILRRARACYGLVWTIDLS